MQQLVIGDRPRAFESACICLQNIYWSQIGCSSCRPQVSGSQTSTIDMALRPAKVPGDDEEAGGEGARGHPSLRHLLLGWATSLRHAEPLLCPPPPSLLTWSILLAIRLGHHRLLRPCLNCIMPSCPVPLFGWPDVTGRFLASVLNSIIIENYRRSSQHNADHDMRHTTTDDRLSSAPNHLRTAAVSIRASARPSSSHKCTPQGTMRST